jgi:hypothetical protein
VPLTADRLQAVTADRYRILRELGSGGMATVFLAEDLKHRRLVAVKVLRPELTAGVGPERFLREIEVAAHLQHPHILPLFDSGQLADGSGVLYYVMPYVDGESLRQRISHEKQLPVGEAVRLAGEIRLPGHGRRAPRGDLVPQQGAGSRAPPADAFGGAPVRAAPGRSPVPGADGQTTGETQGLRLHRRGEGGAVPYGFCPRNTMAWAPNELATFRVSALALPAK